MRKRINIFLICIMLITSCIMVVFPVENVKAIESFINFYPSDDTYINESNPNANMGGYIELQARGQVDDNLNILIKFDLSSITSTNVIKATLKLYYFKYSNGNPVGRLLYLHRLTSDWDENTVTWNTHPGYVPYPGITDFVTVPGLFGDISWNVTEDVKKFVDGTYNNYGWVIDDTESNSDATTIFYSKEGTCNNNLKPRLEIEINNSFPNIPFNPKPINHSINVDINASVLWTCSDPDGDELTYDVYFGTKSNPPLASKDKTQTYYNPPGEMSFNTTYYWRIVAEDEFGAKTEGPVWDFTTSSEPNNPPNIPSNPYPENNSINIPTNIVLTWTGGDPDIGDNVSYDVYFGGMLPIQKIASNISNISINPENLVNGLTYFWNVVAWDNYNASTIGPSWHFTTINPDNRPPNKPTKPSGQTKGKTGQSYTYTTTITDPEADQVYCNWSWGDATYSGWIGPYNNGETVNQSHSWTDKGNYDIKVKAKDIYGLESDWSDPLPVRMPKNKVIYIPLFLQKFFQRFPFFEKILKQ